MRYEEIMRRIAPCGLDCGKCLSNPESPISDLSRELLAELGGFGAVAERFAGMEPAFDKYPAFEAVLQHLAGAKCTGCRDGECLLSSCGVKDCVKEHDVDYCFECSEFPCNKTNLPPALHERWKKNNERMKSGGIEAYLEFVKRQPRY